MSEDRARYGWESDFPTFGETPASQVREQLRAFVADASPEQERAWIAAIPPLQAEVNEVLISNGLAQNYSTILEYELPMESRRPDVILLVGGAVMVMELKGKQIPSQADIDQAAAYARDLRCYHRECATRPVVPVLVPTRARGYQTFQFGVHVTGPDALDQLIARVSTDHHGEPIERERFLAATAYSPLPTLVEAARELFAGQDVRWNTRARAATDPAVNAITATIHHAAKTGTRHLILLTGLPGAGKTLVGLRTVHAHFLDDLAVPRPAGRPTTPAVFLSGNNALVMVLQYALRTSGGDGKTFVRRMKDFIARYGSKRMLVPPEHVLVFDEAQRAFDADMVRQTHGDPNALSEPEHFVEIAERIPDWCVVIGLIGTGQEIHVGEEAGLSQWHTAIARSAYPEKWTIHAPPSIGDALASSQVRVENTDDLELKIELRFHFVRELHHFVEDLLAPQPRPGLKHRASQLEQDGFQLRITRTLDVAKTHLRSRFTSDPLARFGMVASSRDKALNAFGIPNDYRSRQRMKLGPWYVDDETSYSSNSCRLLAECATEFEAQGLELDGTLLAWGTDFMRTNAEWSNASATRYKSPVKNPFLLRLNAYRVLLTRARDTCVVFLPPLTVLDETFGYLLDAGFVSLDAQLGC